MKNIILLGLVSFFSDISSEMVYPLIPLYLTSVFGTSPVLVGIIEGIAESLASLLKVFSGYFTDKYHNKKKVAFLGYATGLVYKLALLIATTWTGILFARVVDRIGKGIRTAPRDVLVTESADKNKIGKSFGIHKALDMAGVALGILLAYFLLGQSSKGINYKIIFAISAIPAIVGLGVLLFVKEKKAEREVLSTKKEPFWAKRKEIDGSLKLYLVVTFLFTLGNSSNTFLLLRAKSVGFTDTNVILLYFIYSITASMLSIPFGKLSDKIGRKKLLVGGYFMFSVVYCGFAFSSSIANMVFLFILYGVYSAMVAGAERAMIADVSPKKLKGTMLGLHSCIVGIALLPASMIAGVLWNTLGVEAPFLLGAILSCIAAILLIILMKNQPSSQRYEKE